MSEGKKAESHPSADRGQGKKTANKRKKSGESPADVGRALKTVYDETLREDVPRDFMDLLGKLS